MYYSVIITSQFKKDYRKIRNRKSLVRLLDDTIAKIRRGEDMESKYRVHPLRGTYADCLECHIKPDWLLIWLIDKSKNTLTLVRTGSHADLF